MGYFDSPCFSTLICKTWVMGTAIASISCVCFHAFVLGFTQSVIGKVLRTGSATTSVLLFFVWYLLVAEVVFLHV